MAPVEIFLQAQPAFSRADMLRADVLYILRVAMTVVGRYSFLCGFSYAIHPVRALVTRVALDNSIWRFGK